MFCKECGKELKKGAQFCNECGTPVRDKKQEQQQEHQQQHEPIQSRLTYQNPTPEQPKTPRTPMTKKTKTLLIASGAALVILFGGYELGSTLTSKDRMINKFQTALVNNDAKTVASLLSSDDPKAKIDENSVKSLLDYFKKNPNKISDVIQDLKTESNLYDRSGDLAPQDITGMAGSLLNQNLIKLEKDGRILFFDRYKININTIYLTLQTNYKNTNLYVDGKEVATSNSQDYQTTVGPFLPGIHEASADLKTNFVDLKTKQEVDAVTSGNQQSVDLSLNGQAVALDLGQNGQNLNLNGKLYIDGSKREALLS